MTDDRLNLVLLSAGSSEQSSTWRLIGSLADATQRMLKDGGKEVRLHTIHLTKHAPQIADSIVAGRPNEALQPMVDVLSEADGLIIGTPVYKASYSGLLKSFLDVVEDDVLLATPTILSATGGTPRHALVPDDQMRPLMAFFRALTTPTSVYAATEDWADPNSLGSRIDRAAGELTVLMEAGVRRQTMTASGKGYRRSFDPRQNTADPTEGVDFDSDLMRLATGGN